MGETYGSQNFWIREAMLRGAKLKEDGRVHLLVICDGTLFFADRAVRLLHDAGCQNITTETKIVKPHPRRPPWMTCLFDVSGTHPAWPDKMPENRWEETPMCQYLAHEFNDHMEREHGKKWWLRTPESTKSDKEEAEQLV